MKRLLAFLAIITVVMIIMAIMANTSKASVFVFKGKLKGETAKLKNISTPKKDNSKADFQVVSYNDQSNLITPIKPECKISEANSETVDYPSLINHNEGADFEVVQYQID